MEFVIIWVLVGLFASRETIPDITAAVKGNTPPSHERRMQRLKARGVDTKQEKTPGTIREALGATMRNASERAAIKRAAKHEGAMRHLEENRDRLSEEKYRKLQARQDRKRAVLDKFARARRVVTETPERVREAQAWRRNAAEPDLLDRDDWDPADSSDEQSEDGQDATVLEFKRAELSSSPDTSDGDDSEDFDDNDSEGSDSEGSDSEDSESDGDSSEKADPGEHMVPDQDRYQAKLDRLETDVARMLAAQRARERVHALVPEQEADQPAGENPTENTSKEKGTTMAEQEQTEQTVEQQPAQQADEPSYETTGLTATLQRVKASSSACHGQVASYDQKLSELQSEHDALAAQIAGLEAQIATLQQRQNSGAQIRALQQAQEQLSSSKVEVGEQITHASNALSQYQSAAASFDEAHAALSRQLPGQDFYTAVSGAGDKTYLSQG